MMKQEMRIKRAHLTLIRHPATSLYAGVMMMGKTEVSDEKFTAYTNGVDCKYSRSFIDSIKSEPKLRGLVLHEKLHVALKHIPRGVSMYEEDARTANMAADMVVNNIIHAMTAKINNEALVELPDGAVFDAKYRGWSFREVYNDLRRNKKGGGGGGDKPCDSGLEGTGSGGSGGEPNFDEHDFSNAKNMTPEEREALEGQIERALREGSIIAGQLGAKIPREISELLKPRANWREELRDFVSSSIKGKEEYTWRKFNRRHIANDIYLPTTEDETIGEVVVAIDTSGSIGSAQLTEFATELASIADSCTPERIRVLWWDTQVHNEQVFEPKDFGQIAHLLKPEGGGGTHVGCVSKYMEKHVGNAECLVVLTDGYVESDPTWTVTVPTLWVVTQNEQWTPPAGKKVVMHD